MTRYFFEALRSLSLLSPHFASIFAVGLGSMPQLTLQEEVLIDRELRSKASPTVALRAVNVALSLIHI